MVVASAFRTVNLFIGSFFDEIPNLIPNGGCSLLVLSWGRDWLEK